jgi:hypothetical protein
MLLRLLVDEVVVDDVFLDVVEGLPSLVVIEVHVHIPAIKGCLVFQPIEQKALIAYLGSRKVMQLKGTFNL